MEVPRGRPGLRLGPGGHRPGLRRQRLTSACGTLNKQRPPARGDLPGQAAVPFVRGPHRNWAARSVPVLVLQVRQALNGTALSSASSGHARCLPEVPYVAGPLDRPAGTQPPKALSADPAVADPGESAREGALRELREETGWTDLEPGPPLCTWEHDFTRAGVPVRQLEHIYVARGPRRDPVGARAAPGPGRRPGRCRARRGRNSRLALVDPAGAGRLARGPLAAPSPAAAGRVGLGPALRFAPVPRGPLRDSPACPPRTASRPRSR
ncbi:NUDIX domain-containing protein [Streptomyces avermitilis]|uniref:NUDIX domain-containing protein n=1 Tax=Streptomyces avermitilis TaxID=33903 RepID=UPI003685035F